MSPGALTVPEAAARLGISTRSMYRLVKSERVPAKRLGRSVRIPATFLDGFLASDAPTLEEYAENTSELDSRSQGD